ncbi:hypothetical protein [Candidatus Vallotiella sp. (ex Adelges kitamiensis)]|nr:hypothetical protein [Candidatus Vallotia sp. (ex Adelges kitamiensis)]
MLLELLHEVEVELSHAASAHRADASTQVMDCLVRALTYWHQLPLSPSNE